MSKLMDLVTDKEEWNEGFSTLEMEYEKLQEQILRVKRFALILQLYKDDSELQCYLEQLENARIALQ